MGNTIHCYIEYRDMDKDRITNEWKVFASDMLLNLNGFIINAMTGCYDDKLSPSARLYDIKGLPKDVSYDILEECTLDVYADGTCISDYIDSDTIVYRSEAEEFIKLGKSVYVGYNQDLILDPNNWGYTWFSIGEYNIILQSLNVIDSELPIDYLAVLNLMAFFQDMGKEVRLIVWFS